VALKNNTSINEITLINNKVKFINLTSDISCKAYDGKNAEPQLCPNPTTQNTRNPTIATQNITLKTGKLQGSSEDETRVTKVRMLIIHEHIRVERF
jgi:hypothetical protein